MSLTQVGVGQSRMPLTLTLSIATLPSFTINPKNSTSSFSKEHFSGLRYKVSWDSKDLNDHSIHDKLQDQDRDPYLQKTAEGTYLYCPDGSLNQYDSGDEKDWHAASRYNGLINYPSFWDNETHLRGITVMDRWRAPTISQHSRGGLIEKRPESVREIFRGFMSDPLLDWQFASGNLEDRERNLTIFKTCGVDILWFGTAREMFHGIIGAIVGQYFEIVISSLTHVAGG